MRCDGTQCDLVVLLPSCAVQTLRAMLARGGSEVVAAAVGSAGGWELMENPERHHEGIAVLAG